MTQKHSFQSIILTLQNYWASHGCLLWQPYYTQVGAGTMNPATFLRVLGPEPWNVAYVEPSVRPDDGRYGENPNRLQMHYQFQVILKPEPGNPQELYLDSLRAIGIDPRQHDIRFVEDNWEQPAISAWGLGWEVWLDGQEITQFTYFQQVGGVALDPVAVEITYGLDRVLIALNNAKGIWEEPWGESLGAGQVTYGEIRRREEFEHSKYYYKVADVARARQMYELYLAECEACLAQGLVLPAHDYVLKSSHTFNILDARGAVSLTERQASFAKMRDLARRVALTYLEQRKELGYPLLKNAKGKTQNAESPAPQSAFPAQPSTFVLEIGVEELPAADVDAALAQLRQKAPAWLKELRLEHGPLTVYATPRRLVLSIENLAASQPDREDLVKGPPADRAFDSTGKPTPAAAGFAKKNGIDISALQVREIDGGKYAVATVRSQGRPAHQVLSETLPAFIAAITFIKTMRWNNSGAAFSRPLRWFVALLGEQVVPFEYAGIASGNVSRGLRPYDSPAIVIKNADSYFAAIREANILLDTEERKTSIVKQVTTAAQTVGGEAIIEAGLLAEVANLIEQPTAVLGGFNPEFLDLPRDVLIGTMKKHQRYFPVVRPSGAAADQLNGTPATLLPFFIAIRNGDDLHLDIVKEGNEHVLGARFADANFFVREDVRQPLESYREKLKTLTFQTRLGSMYDKSERILRLAQELGSMLALTDSETQALRRAAFLAKADLATQMVTEMTSLQGIIGREYALRGGESPQVAQAIGEQYLPVPQTRPGLALALADRIDSLVGLFAVGLAPTGAKDPFGLRRAAIGVVQPLMAHNLEFDLRAAVEKSSQTQPMAVPESVQAQVLDFLAGRLKVALNEAGYRYDVVDAVLAAQSNNPAGCAQAVQQLMEWINRPDWTALLDGYARCVRITRPTGSPSSAVNPAALVEPAEKALYQALQTVPHQPQSINDLLQAVQNLLPAITDFFEHVLVMEKDENVRQNRLALLGQIASLTAGLADLSKLEGF